uniref:Uncharacterized protein n=1 Tax=Anguilla anguilla TaxID=7936 RepID=A0A0E9WEQ9_ANGAN
MFWPLPLYVSIIKPSILRPSPVQPNTKSKHRVEYDPTMFMMQCPWFLTDLGQIRICPGFKHPSTLYRSCLAYWNQWNTLNIGRPN